MENNYTSANLKFPAITLLLHGNLWQCGIFIFCLLLLGNPETNAAVISGADPCTVTFTSVTGTETCLNTAALVTLNGLVPNSISTVSYTKSGMVQTPATVTANALGVGAFPVLVTASGQTIAITGITRTDVTPGCTFTPSANNTVTFALNSGCTSVQSSQCGIMLSAIDSYIYANLIMLADSYRWRVTTLSGSTAGQIQYAYTVLRNLRITQLGAYAFDTQYKIEVATYRNGAWSPYGAVCTVQTPASATQLATCGGTIPLNAMADAVFANLVPFANGYRFRVSDPFNPFIYEELIRPTREFRMSLITAFSVQFNKMYNVEVAVRNTNGNYLPYGPLCTIKTPMFATTSIRDSQCDDYAVPDYSTLIYADSCPGAIFYAFKVTGPGLPPHGSVVIKQLRAFSLGELPALHAGEIYDVRVRLIFNANDNPGPYGKTCSFMAPASAAKSTGKSTFDVVAYPNPFSDNFRLSITTASVSKASIKTYDIIGRLIGITEKSPPEMTGLQIGNDYPAGVYTIIIRQDESLRSLKIVKR